MLPIFSSEQQSGASGGSTGSGAGVSGTCRNSILQNYKTKPLNKVSHYLRNYSRQMHRSAKNNSNALNYGRITGGGYPDDAIRVSCDDDVLSVPFVHLRHTAAQDLLAAPGERVGTRDGVAVNAPYVDVRSSTGHDISLYNKGLRIKIKQFIKR